MTLDPKSFTISVTDKITGELVRGAFKVKTRLSWRDQLARERIRLDLLGPLAAQASVRAREQADLVSELAVRIVEAPQFWKEADNGLDLQDDAIMVEVFNEAIKAEAEAIAALKKLGEEAKVELAKIG